MTEHAWRKASGQSSNTTYVADATTVLFEVTSATLDWGSGELQLTSSLIVNNSLPVNLTLVETCPLPYCMVEAMAINASGVILERFYLLMDQVQFNETTM